MKLIFLGSGAAFGVKNDNYHSNMILVADNNERFLIDCGADARHSLADQGLFYSDIDHVYISHLHSDHVGGLEWLALCKYFDPACNKPTIYAHPSILNIIWDHTLKGGLSTIQRVKTDLNFFFDIVKADQEGIFEWNGIKMQTVQSVHIMNNYEYMPSFGLIFKANDTNVFITTDTQFAPHQLYDLYRHADVIYQDCETLENPSGVHANYKELLTLDGSIKSKMWLYHYNSTVLPDAKADGFLGFVKKGQVFEF